MDTSFFTEIKLAYSDSSLSVHFGSTENPVHLHLHQDPEAPSYKEIFVDFDSSYKDEIYEQLSRTMISYIKNNNKDDEIVLPKYVAIKCCKTDKTDEHDRGYTFSFIDKPFFHDKNNIAFDDKRKTIIFTTEDELCESVEMYTSTPSTYGKGEHNNEN